MNMQAACEARSPLARPPARGQRLFPRAVGSARVWEERGRVGYGRLARRPSRLIRGGACCSFALDTRRRPWHHFCSNDERQTGVSLVGWRRRCRISLPRAAAASDSTQLLPGTGPWWRPRRRRNHRHASTDWRKKKAGSSEQD